MSKLTHHFATLREVKMHYVTAGAGPTTLVLLHGYPQSWYCWRQVITELQNEYSLVAPNCAVWAIRPGPPVATTSGRSRPTSTSC